MNRFYLRTSSDNSCSRTRDGKVTPDAAVLAGLAHKKSVLDSVTKDLGSFLKRLPAEDKMRAALQLQAIQTMEAQIAKQQAGGGVACMPPMVDSSVDYKQSASLPTAIRAYIDITVAAMACDLTRVMVMSTHLGDGGDFTCPWAPVDAPDAGHHALSHGGTNSKPDGGAQARQHLADRAAVPPPAHGGAREKAAEHPRGRRRDDAR